MESAFHIVVSQRLKSQEIACEAYAVLGNRNVNKRRNKIYTFTIVEGPQKPNLTVLYHRPPSIVEVGKMLVAQCDACVGINGNITWRLLNASDQPVVNERLLQLLTLDENVNEGNLTR
ncbi:hypothetical protein PoB_001188200 [Plakobranchus ocellatus]|uniref:Uncharacterized protein n=1 Tax=Plakobranchus ocellatus TaxID=259542 RepID=A0AAV3YSC9_9GAST|nr:hypothetical protein PoB_001188200 [Plakobranchus ocellatus]